MEMRLARTENGEGTVNRDPVIGSRLVRVLRSIRAAIFHAVRWTPWIAIVAFAAACAYWKPPPLDQSWWLVIAALWAAPSGALAQTGLARIRLIAVASCAFVFAWAFYRMQIAFMSSMSTWRFAQDSHCYDLLSRSIRLTIAGTATAWGLGIPLTRLAMRAALPIAAIAVMPYVVLIERHTIVSIGDWIQQPFVSSIQLLVTLIPPSLFLGVCFLLRKLFAKHVKWIERHPVLERLIRWELRSAHPAVAVTLYSATLFSLIACIYLQPIVFATDISSSALQGLLFIVSMFLFARLTVATWYSLTRHKFRGLLAKYVRWFWQGSVVVTCVFVLALALFEAPLASVAIARAVDQVGAPAGVPLISVPKVPLLFLGNCSD